MKKEIILVVIISSSVFLFSCGIGIYTTPSGKWYGVGVMPQDIARAQATEATSQAMSQAIKNETENRGKLYSAVAGAIEKDPSLSKDISLNPSNDRREIYRNSSDYNYSASGSYGSGYCSDIPDWKAKQECFRAKTCSKHPALAGCRR